MSSVQTLENPPEQNEQDDPPEVTQAATARKTAFKVFATSAVTGAVTAWVDEHGAKAGVLVNEHGETALPSCIDSDDLICLGTYEATSRDGAVEQMMADPKPLERVKLVQLTYAAHVDMWFPVLSVASGYVKDVPAVWEINPVSRIGGR